MRVFTYPQSSRAWLIPVFAAAVAGLTLGWRRKRRWKLSTRILLLSCCLAIAAAGATVAWGAEGEDEQPTIRELIHQFSDPKKAEEFSYLGSGAADSARASSAAQKEISAWDEE